MQEAAPGRLMWAIELDEATPSLNQLRKLNPRQYQAYRKAMALKIWAACGGRLPVHPLPRAFLQVTRACAGHGLDWDNAMGGLKPLIDCLVAASARNPDGLGFIRDDNRACLPRQPELIQQEAPRGAGRTTVQIFSFEESV